MAERILTLDDFDYDEMFPPVQTDEEHPFLTFLAGLFIALIFVVFFVSAVPERPTYQYVPGHWEQVKPRMTD